MITLSGIMMDSREVHSVNAAAPMLVIPLGISMEVKEVHPMNGLLPMLVTLLGITMDFRNRNKRTHQRQCW